MQPIPHKSAVEWPSLGHDQMVPVSLAEALGVRPEEGDSELDLAVLRPGSFGSDSLSAGPFEHVGEAKLGTAYRSESNDHFWFETMDADSDNTSSCSSAHELAARAPPARGSCSSAPWSAAKQLSGWSATTPRCAGTTSAQALPQRLPPQTLEPPPGLAGPRPLALATPPGSLKDRPLARPPPGSWSFPPPPAPCRLARTRPEEIVSGGTVGHPYACAGPCPRLELPGGCALGIACPFCHACPPFRETHKAAERAARAELQGRAPPISLASAWSRGARSAVDPCAPPASKGSIGHPHNCSQPCKYNRGHRVCKDGADCTRCHICVWTLRHDRRGAPRPSGQPRRK